MRLSSSSTLLRVASSSPRALCLSLAYNRSPTIIRVTSSGPAAAVPLLPSSYLYSTQSQNSSSQTLKSVPEIYLSHSIDPYFNLAFEDWLFRSKPVEAIALLFYRNSPCVIIGRNQNPWKEINFPILRRLRVPFVRRRSGGGTVYHDLGNTNYSIALPRVQFDRRTNAELVAKAIRSLGPPATVNERNDVVVEGYKVSGSAYKIINQRAYHHGTMLINAKLNDLGDVLRNTKITMRTKGVDSVRSPVKNLCQFTTLRHTPISHESFVTAVSQQFSEMYYAPDGIIRLPIQDVYETSHAHIPRIQEVRKELQSWEWAYGQSPEFTHVIANTFSWGKVNASFHSKRGLILACDISYLPPPPQHSLKSLDAEIITRTCKTLGEDLVGKKYGVLEGVDSNGTLLDPAEVRRDILEWLLDDM